MRRTERFSERVGAVFLPEAEPIRGDGAAFDSSALDLGADGLAGGVSAAGDTATIVRTGETVGRTFIKRCNAVLESGCYTVSFVPDHIPILGTRYRGTLRIENRYPEPTISGDLYRYSPFELGIFEVSADRLSDEAADIGTIPIYRRRDYHSYLKGTAASLRSYVPWYTDCRTVPFTLEFDEFVYTHPATGFSGTFNATPTRSLRYVLTATSTPYLYAGDAYIGSTKIGTVSMRWVSNFYRRAHLQMNTLQGAATPQAVGTATIASIFADAGWQLTVTNGGTISLPPTLAGITTTACWSPLNMHTLMSSVPGYRAGDLDAIWRVHLVAIPAALGCGRGLMFDSSFGADPDAVPREGSATFSDDGYPTTDPGVSDGMGGTHYDAAAGLQQRNVPRAFLRSATHEVGHAFNQIHQGLEGTIDNSIMTPTNNLATVIGLGGTFPDDINLAFNERVKKHLRHLPDPAVRPGAINFFNNAVVSPEPADVAWLQIAELTIEASSERPRLGELVTLEFTLKNTGDVPLPVPWSLDQESLTVRVNVTDPNGKITFMRPAFVQSCPELTLQTLGAGESRSGSTTVFWGPDGFAFETPGRHIVEVIALWNIAGVPVGTTAEHDIFVRYPVTEKDNEVAALLLDPEVGAAIGAGTTTGRERAAERLNQASALAKTHSAVTAVRRLGLLGAPPRKRPDGTSGPDGGVGDCKSASCDRDRGTRLRRTPRLVGGSHAAGVTAPSCR